MKTPPKTCGRTVSRSDYQPEHQRAKEKTTTEKFKQIRKEHPKVERKLGEVVNRHGGRKAKYFGVVKVTVQQTMAALATNVKRIVRLSHAQAETVAVI